MANRDAAMVNFTLKPGDGFRDDLLYVDGKAAGLVEATKERVIFTRVGTQSHEQQMSEFSPVNETQNLLCQLG